MLAPEPILQAMLQGILQGAGPIGLLRGLALVCSSHSSKWASDRPVEGVSGPQQDSGGADAESIGDLVRVPMPNSS